jgi:putative ATPase
LQHTPEGGVVIQVPDGSDAERLGAQLRVLDSLQQPRIVQGPLHALNSQLMAGEQFEWIAARHPFRQLSTAEIAQAIAKLDQLAAPAAQLRLLFSHPAMGPATALVTSAGVPAAVRDLLEPAQASEASWLERTPDPAAVENSLATLGWQVHWQQWREPLELTLSEGLIERWLGPEARYRRQLATLIPTDDLELLHRELRNLVGLKLPQQLEHQRLVATRRHTAKSEQQQKPAPA